jgi:hypothetical protein
MKRRWLELGKIPSSKLTYTQVEEQFHLAQALTALLDRVLYDNLTAHRAKCLELIREEQDPKGGTKYNIVSASKPRRHISWREVELTPDITFTMSDELVGKIIPHSYVKVLKRMIQIQGRLLLTLEDT